MGTVVRAVISEKNKYWISKHRHYELKHFCLQYPSWKSKYNALEQAKITMSTFEHQPGASGPNDITAAQAIKRARLAEKISLIEDMVREADPYLYDYILKAVTEGLSYTYLKTNMNIPCGKDMYYDRYRKFFWLLSEARD